MGKFDKINETNEQRVRRENLDLGVFIHITPNDDKKCYCEEIKKEGKDIACFICGKGTEIKESCDLNQKTKERSFKDINQKNINQKNINNNQKGVEDNDK